jgi:L-amino acid N-acyltransferase YncA
MSLLPPSADPAAACTIRVASANDAVPVSAIYNQGIASRAATFETRERSVEEMARQLTQPMPQLVAIIDQHVVGWAGMSAYRERTCYRGVAEFSIYIETTARAKGIGRKLLTALVEHARLAGYWKLLSRIFPSNHASLALCRAVGFREVGHYQRHAQLDGVWLDVVIVELLIPENQP